MVQSSVAVATGKVTATSQELGPTAKNAGTLLGHVITGATISVAQPDGKSASHIPLP